MPVIRTATSTSSMRSNERSSDMLPAPSPSPWRSSQQSPSQPTSAPLRCSTILIRTIVLSALIIYIFVPSRIVSLISEHPSFASVSHAGRKVLETLSYPPTSSDTANTSPSTPSVKSPHRLASELCRPGESGVAIVAACMNRQETLTKVLPTWLSVRGVSQVVVVDWGSSPPLRPILRRHKDDDRLTLIRVQNESAWVLSRAYNLAVNATTCPFVVRTDCDYALHEDLLQEHAFEPSRQVFYAGNWLMARNENEIHLNGALLVKRNSFTAVGGYDERIQTYGWDDEDLYTRLLAANMTKLNVSYDHITHFAHDDTKRTQTGVKFAQVQIDVNQLLLDQLPTWDKKMRESKDSSQYSTLRKFDDYENGRFAELQAVHVPLPLAKRVSTDDYNKAWSLALGRRLADDHQIPWDVQSAMAPQTRERLLRQLMHLQDWLDASRENGTTTMTVAGGKQVDLPDRARCLLVHCMHGLGNRLRALGSALAFAKTANRVPVVIWERDAHIAAEFGDLFDESELVVLNSFGPKWPFENMHEYDASWKQFDFYNYMEMEEGATKGEPVVNNQEKHVYYKGAYVLESPDYTWWEADNTELKQRLKPVPMVQKRLKELEEQGIRNAIGVHIRNRTLEEDIKDVDFVTEYGEAATRELTRWREQSCYETFIEEMAKILKKNDNDPGVMFYIATDTWKVVEIMQRRFPDRILTTERECDDRDAMCAKFAVIDLFALSRTKELLGSNWSSYTEVAERLGGHKARLAGRDFGPAQRAINAKGANKMNANAAANAGAAPPSKVSLPVVKQQAQNSKKL